MNCIDKGTNNLTIASKNQIKNAFNKKESDMSLGNITLKEEVNLPENKLKELDADLNILRSLKFNAKLTDAFIGGLNKRKDLITRIERLVDGANEFPHKKEEIKIALKYARKEAIELRERSYQGAGMGIATVIGAPVGMAILVNMQGTDNLIATYDKALAKIKS